MGKHIYIGIWSMTKRVYSICILFAVFAQTLKNQTYFD